MAEPLMTDGTVRSGLSQGTVEAIVRERLALIERVRELEARNERAAHYLRESLPALRFMSDEADLNGDQTLASVAHRVHEEIVAFLAPDQAP